MATLRTLAKLSWAAWLGACGGDQPEAAGRSLHTNDAAQVGSDGGVADAEERHNHASEPSDATGLIARDAASAEATPVPPSQTPEAGISPIDGATALPVSQGTVTAQDAALDAQATDGASVDAAPEAGTVEPRDAGAADSGSVHECDAGADACQIETSFLVCADGTIGDSSSCALGVEVVFTYGDLLAQPFTPPRDLKLSQFGARTGPHSGSCSAYLSLHADRDGQPGLLINAANYRSLAKDSANLTSPISGIDQAVSLHGGQRYWLVARLGGEMGQACRFYVANANAPEQSFRIRATETVLAPDDLLPDQTQLGPGGLLSLFIVARP
jgi:hypothetical protein